MISLLPISAESTDPSPSIFAWFHTTFLSHGLTMCPVSPAFLSSQTSTVHQTALMPLLDTKLWFLSGCYPTGCSSRKLFVLPEGFPYAILGSPIRWDFLKVCCCLDQSVSIFFHTNTGTKHCFFTGMLPGDSCICDLSWCVCFIFTLWLWFVTWRSTSYSDLFFYFFFQQSTIPIQQVSNKTFVVILWMQCMLVEWSNRSGKTSSWNTQLTLSNLFPQKRMKLHTLKLPVNIAICCTSSYCQEIYTRDMPLTHTWYLCDWVDCDLEHLPPHPSMSNLLPVSRLLNVPQNICV